MKTDSHILDIAVQVPPQWGLKAGLMAGCGLILGGVAAEILPQIYSIGTFDAYAIGAMIAAFGCAGAGLVAWGTDRQRQQQQIDTLERIVSTLSKETHSYHQKIKTLETAIVSGHQTRHSETNTQQIRSELQVLQQLLAQVIKERGAVSEQSPARPAALKLRSVDKSTLHPVAQTLNEETILSVMRSALEDSRIDLYLQPVVKLPSRNIIHYEAFSRVRDEQGDIIFPVDYLKAAGTAGLVATLDNLLLFRCINLIRKLGQRKLGTAIFLNLASGSLADAGFMADFVSFMTAHKELAERLVFEISADALPRLDQGIMAQLKLLARAGYIFSIDHITDLGLDFAKLADWNVRFIKVEAATLLAEHNNVTPTLKQYLARFNIELIATHIEHERAVVDILDLGISYGQGFLFGSPKPAKHNVTKKVTVKPIARQTDDDTIISSGNRAVKRRVA